MKKLLLIMFPLLLFAACASDNLDDIAAYYPADIPLPEHPRPDWEREAWLNLNGQWAFAPDSSDVGERENWFAPEMDAAFTDVITVPFSWAAPLSGIGNPMFDFAWYMREIMIPRGGIWAGKRYWLVIGASDFTTTLWVNGQLVGEHEGGYTPIEFDITDHLVPGDIQRLVIRTEDLGIIDRPEGKQILGEAKGIWQTVYLEGRSPQYIEYAHFIPDIDSSRVSVAVKLTHEAEEDLIFSVAFEGEIVETFAETFPAGTDSMVYTIPVPDQHLWTLDDPFLYYLNIGLDSVTEELDRIYSYFGMRKIGLAYLPDSEDVYVTLNNMPLYLKMALDQSFHPTGFYTFPTDEFMQDEIIRAKQLGLNGLRIHVKTEIPRKLYWADRHGLLIMADIPNWRGDPDDDARRYWASTAKAQIMRDFNHPSIFSWVLFNENRGISTLNINGIYIYLPQTRDWVREMYQWVKMLDPTRLVDDNATDSGDHIATDINSWHASVPGRLWGETLDEVVRNTSPGSGWNFTGGAVQGNQPLINTACGAFMGYRYGTGDIDITYDYHQMMNELRRRQKIAGFVHDGFFDVINDWSGYYRYDRSLKEFGLDELCPGMTMADFHSSLFLIPGEDFEMVVAPDSTFLMPVTASFLANVMPIRLDVQTRLHGWNRLGEHREYATGDFSVVARPFAVFDLPQVQVTAPPEECLAIWTTTLLDPNGNVLHRNFVPFRVEAPDTARVVTTLIQPEPLSADTSGTVLPPPRRFRQAVTRIEEPDPQTIILRQRPTDYAEAEWSGMTKAVLDTMKVWGTGTGYFEYHFMMPEGIAPDDIAAVIFSAELSSRQVQAKDLETEPFEPYEPTSIDPRHRDPGYSPNSYPQTDQWLHSSELTVSLNDGQSYNVTLDDDPADHRGLLSWMSQPTYDMSWALDEPGSYGYLVTATFGEAMARKAAEEGAFRIRLEVPFSDDRTGGLAVYGEQFGRYPVGPMLVIKRR